MKKKLAKKTIAIVKKPSIKKVHESSVSDRFNKIILDNVPVSIITIDKKGYITSANKYFKNFSSSINDYHNNIFAGSFFIRENLVEDYKKLLTTGGVFRRDNCHEVNSKGEDKYFRIIAVPFRNKKGEIEGVISLASDNTEAVTFRNKLLELNSGMEKEIKERTKDLDEANKELGKTVELKSIFMADVSHEFRTSLTIMQCSLELLYRSCEAKKENSELFQNVNTEIKRVSTMLTNLALLNETDSPKLKSYFQKLNLNKLISSICNELKVVADDKNVKIEHKNSDSIIEIIGNKQDLEKMLLNLLRNAINYNKDNGWIKVSVKENKDGVYLNVEDSGVGIPKEEFSNIFERFYRVDRARTRNNSESGLGLAICKHVAEMHGGNISVSSKLGQGSVFTVYLPYDPKKVISTH